MVAATYSFERGSRIGLMRLTRIYKYSNCTMCRTQCSKCAGCKWYSKARWIQGAVHCHRCEPDKAAVYRHNYSRAEYKCWKNMIARCTQPEHQCWNYYGGRGITVCRRWLKSYRHFIDDMGPRPSDKHSIDRINNDGNYEPSNCRWATAKEQGRNQRTTKWMEAHGRRMIQKDWAQFLGISEGHLVARLKCMSVADALSSKPMPRKPPKPRKVYECKARREMLTHNGETKSLWDWAEQAGMSVAALQYRLKHSPMEVALSKPRYVHTKFHKAS